MDEWQEKYERLERKYNRLEREKEELQKRYDKLYDENDHNKFRIRNELEPMIASRNRAYDNWVTDPSRGRDYD